LSDHFSVALDSIGFDDHRREEFAALHDPSLVPGRIIRVDRGIATALTDGADLRVAIPLFLDLAVGDWVAVAPDHSIHSVLERRSAVTRLVGDRRETVQVMAANVDLILIMRPLDLSVSVTRVQALLTLTYESGAVPLVVLTKSDLVEDPQAAIDEVTSFTLGTDVVALSVVTGEGLDDLRERIAGRTIVLLGESGAGKSTLTNLLAGEHVLDVGETAAGGQGRHTTSHRQLVPLPIGGAVIDTPGLRDVAEVAEACRFADCAHGTEPGCAIRAALEDGSLTSERYAAYEAALRDAAWNARRADKQAQAEQKAVYRARAKARRNEVW
jgi:ribosome biogenesis GTPase